MRCPNCQLQIQDGQSKMYSPSGWCHSWCYCAIMTAYRATQRKMYGR